MKICIQKKVAATRFQFNNQIMTINYPNNSYQDTIAKKTL